MYRLIAIAVLLLPLGTTASTESPSAEMEPLAREAQELLDAIEQDRLRYRELSERRGELEGEEQAVVRLQMRKQLLEMMAAIDTLVGNVLEQEEQGLDAAAFREQTTTLLLDLESRFPAFLASLDGELSALRAALEGADREASRELSGQIREIEELADAVFSLYLDHLGHLEGFGLPPDTPRADLASRIGRRAETLAGRLERARERLDEAKRDAEASPEYAALEQAVRTELEFVAASLSRTCDVMEEIGLETAEHRQLIIQATGEITSDVLDTEVAAGLIEQALEGLRGWVRRSGPTLLARMGVFLSILALFWLASRATRRAVGRLVHSTESNLSELARRMIVSTSSRGVLIIGFFVAVSQLGVEVTALLAGLGIVGFILGFALQDSLSNLASGAMILMYRPFDVGHSIQVGTLLGTVSDMNLVSTTVLTPDNQTLVVPNSKIWGDVIRNFTAQKTRRVDLKFGVSYAADLVRAEAVFESILAEHPKVLAEPPPAVKVHELAESSVRFAVYPWVKTEDYWEVYWDVTREVKLRLDREGIRPGLPRRDVRLVSEGGDPAASPNERVPDPAR